MEIAFQSIDHVAAAPPTEQVAICSRPGQNKDHRPGNFWRWSLCALFCWMSIGHLAAEDSTNLPAGLNLQNLEVLDGETNAFRADGSGWKVVLPPESFAVVKVKE